MVMSTPGGGKIIEVRNDIAHRSTPTLVWQGTPPPRNKVIVTQDHKSVIPKAVVSKYISDYVHETITPIIKRGSQIRLHWDGKDLKSLHVTEIQSTQELAATSPATVSTSIPKSKAQEIRPIPKSLDLRRNTDPQRIPSILKSPRKQVVTASNSESILIEDDDTPGDRVRKRRSNDEQNAPPVKKPSGGNISNVSQNDPIEITDSEDESIEEDIELVPPEEELTRIKEIPPQNHNTVKKIVRIAKPQVITKTLVDVINKSAVQASGSLKKPTTVETLHVPVKFIGTGTQSIRGSGIPPIAKQASQVDTLIAPPKCPVETLPVEKSCSTAIGSSSSPILIDDDDEDDSGIQSAADVLPEVDVVFQEGSEDISQQFCQDPSNRVVNLDLGDIHPNIISLAEDGEMVLDPEKYNAYILSTYNYLLKDHERFINEQVAAYQPQRILYMPPAQNFILNPPASPNHPFNATPRVPVISSLSGGSTPVFTSTTGLHNASQTQPTLPFIQDSCNKMLTIQQADSTKAYKEYHIKTISNLPILITNQPPVRLPHPNRVLPASAYTQNQPPVLSNAQPSTSITSRTAGSSTLKQLLSQPQAQGQVTKALTSPVNTKNLHTEVQTSSQPKKKRIKMGFLSDDSKINTVSVYDDVDVKRCFLMLPKLRSDVPEHVKKMKNKWNTLFDCCFKLDDKQRIRYGVSQTTTTK